MAVKLFVTHLHGTSPMAKISGNSTREILLLYQENALKKRILFKIALKFAQALTWLI